MPLDLDFNAEPMETGESRELILRSPLPAEVKIRCFVHSPPPGYRACDECGTFKIKTGESVAVHAGPRVFGDGGGHLEIEISDSSGQSRRFRLNVLRRDEAAAGELVKEEVKM